MRSAIAFFFALPYAFAIPQQDSALHPPKRLEVLYDKTFLVFTPHPNDDVFGAGGTIALLNRNHNKVFIVVYTNDDKCPCDLDMNFHWLAQIRDEEPRKDGHCVESFRYATGFNQF